MKNERVIEFLIGMIFLIFIFIITLIGFNLDSFDQKTSYNQIYTSVNINNIYVNNEFNFEKKDILNKEDPDTYTFSSKTSQESKNIYPKDYNSSGFHKKSESLGLYTDTYEVIIKNTDKSRCFEVKFHIEDSKGNDKTFGQKKYIYFGEEKRFYYREINKDYRAHNNWNYDILDCSDKDLF